MWLAFEQADVRAELILKSATGIRTVWALCKAILTEQVRFSPVPFLKLVFVVIVDPGRA